MTWNSRLFGFIFSIFIINKLTGDKQESYCPHDVQYEFLFDWVHQREVVKEKHLHDIIVGHHACIGDQAHSKYSRKDKVEYSQLFFSLVKYLQILFLNIRRANLSQKWKTTTIPYGRGPVNILRRKKRWLTDTVAQLTLVISTLIFAENIDKYQITRRLS